MTVSRSIHISANDTISFLFMSEKYSVVSSVDGHLDCFHALAAVNSADMNVGLHVSF